MFLSHLIVWLIFCHTCFADAYVKPNYSKRTLAKKENRELLSSCGRPPIGRFRHKIWNPKMVNRTEAPWVVAVLSSTKWTPNMTVEEMYTQPSSICSGTLISSRHVLTAAHCIQKNILRHYLVIDFQCGKNNINCHGGPMFLRKAARVFTSVRYLELNKDKNDANGADLAIFELTEDIPISTEVWPACLGDTEVAVGEVLDIYGYGTHGANNNSYALQHAPVEAAKCQKPTFDQFCSYVPYQKPCGGDSGAGIIRTDRHGRKHVVAVHKGGTFCDYINEQAVFGPEGSAEKMHTGIEPHLYWICEATGICGNEKIEKDVEIWANLPNRLRERYVVQEPLEENKIYV